MKGRQKQFEQLDELELEYRVAVLAGLRRCASGGNSLFFHAAHLVPEGWGHQVHCPETDGLLEAGEGILTRRRQLGLDPDESLAAEFKRACEAAMNLEGHNRLGTARYAAALLAEIERPS